MRSIFKILFENFFYITYISMQLIPLYTFLCSILVISSSSYKLEINNQSNIPSIILRTCNESNNVPLSQFTLNSKNLAQDYRNFPLSSFKQSDLQHNRKDIQNNLYFIYYKNGRILFKSSLGNESTSGTSIYKPIIKFCVNEKISFIFHGWTESCQTEWIPKLIERLTFHRGGCIICIDYSAWSKKAYIELLKKFDGISEVLYKEVLLLIQNGIDPSKMFMFGFSYGGQIASKIGRLLKPQYLINKIDICDMAGPGFDFLTHLNHSEAAENVQCYYSSLDKGSHFHSCHQNIRLGHCGYTQPAVLSQPYFSSHGLCVRIYINAFDFPFYALQKSPRLCERGKTIYTIPQEFTVGYKEGSYYNGMIGDIFVPTSLNYPYNLSKKEIVLYRKYLEEI